MRITNEGLAMLAAAIIALAMPFLLFVALVNALLSAL